MNPWAFIAIALGILLIIIGVKGSQHNITGAITGKKTGSSTAPSSGSSGSGVILA